MLACLLGRRNSLAGLLVRVVGVVRWVVAIDNAGKMRRGRPFGPDNPPPGKGRPKGSRNRTTILCQDLLDGQAAGVMAKAVELALAGDPVALRLVVDRIYPRGSARPVGVAVPHVRQPADLVEALSVVIDCAAGGQLSLAEAQAFAGLLDLQRKAIETHDLAVRVQLLERVKS
jgi:hypothetical protein